MLTQDQLQRLNELAKKKKTDGLTPDETKEQQNLREAYLEAFRSGMKQTIENLTVVDPNGNDVTPEKVKEIQRQKKLIQ